MLFLGISVALLGIVSSSRLTWERLKYNYNPIIAYPGSVAEKQFSSAITRNSPYITGIVNLELNGAKEGFPVRSVYWITDNFQPQSDGSIKAKTKQVLVRGIAYAQPLFKVGLDPSVSLNAYINANKLQNATYSVIKINPSCVNDEGVNPHFIGVYSHDYPNFFHLTYYQTILKSIFDSTDPKLDEKYDTQMPLIIPAKCYTQIPIKSTDLGIALLSGKKLQAIDKLLADNDPKSLNDENTEDSSDEASTDDEAKLSSSSRRLFRASRPSNPPVPGYNH